MAGSETQKDVMLAYIKANPGCYVADLLRGTGFSKFIISSELTKMAESRDIKRHGVKGRYQYTFIEPQDRPSKEQRNRNIGDQINPLTKFFNDSLAAVRGGRAEV